MTYHQLEPALRIGKSGITDTVVDHIKKLFKKSKVIKIKFLASAVEGNKKALARELAERTNSKVVQQVGFVVVLERNKL